MNTPDAYESILAIDVGAIHTRAFLFEIVENQYRYIAQGVSRTTAMAPILDIMPGVLAAVRELELVTARSFIGPDDKLLVGPAARGNSVDGLTATISAGPEIKIILAGLLANLSLESGMHLAATTDARVSDSISATDNRKAGAQIDSFIKALPDIVILTGGTESGASRAIHTVLENIRLACSLLPRDKRPGILFAGNSALIERVKNSVGTQAPVTYTSNIRPTLDAESLDPAQTVLAEMAVRVRSRQVTGAVNLDQLAGNKMMLTSASFGRMLRFLGKIYTSRGGVLGIDMGSGGTTLAAGKDNRLYMVLQRHDNTDADQGAGIFQPQELQRWIPLEIKDEQIRDYLMNRSAFPGSIASTPEDLAIEYALARQLMKQVLLTAARYYPHLKLMQYEGVNFGFEPVIVTGAMMSRASSAAHCLMMILDGLQPAGITTIVLDQNNILPVLGAAGQLAPALPVDVLNSGVMQNLCTVISPVSPRKQGAMLMRARLTFDSKEELHLAIRQGDLLAVPLAYGQSARLYIETETGTDIGLRRSRQGINIKVSGGVLGLVFDARGRPVRLPTDAGNRRALLNDWLSALAI